MRSLKMAARVLVLIAHAAHAQTFEIAKGRGAQLMVFVPAQEPAGAAAAQENASGLAADGHMQPEFAIHDVGRRSATLERADHHSAQGAKGMQTLPLGPIVDIPRWTIAGPAMGAQDQADCAGSLYRPAGFLHFAVERRRSYHYPIMRRIACDHGLPVALFDAMILRESAYRPDAVSPKNAFGLAQLMPETARALGVDRYGVEGNLRGGARYLREQIDRFGQYHLALAAYNAGPGRVRGGRVPAIAETRAYVDNVLLNWSRLVALPSQSPISGVAPRPAMPWRRAETSLFK